MWFVKFRCVTFIIFSLLGSHLSYGLDENLSSLNQTFSKFESEVETNTKSSLMGEPTVLKRHFNESMEKVQLMRNGVMTKSAFVPLTAHGSSLGYVENVPESNADNKRIELENDRRFEHHIKNSNNTIITRNGKKYKRIKINKMARHHRGANGSTNYTQKRGLSLFPNILSILPIKWLTREMKNETNGLRADNSSIWPKLEPVHHVEESKESQNLEVQSSDKIKKLLNLFTIVKFPNGECYADGMVGICVHESECKANGGKFTSNCAKEFGVCCYYEKTCGGQTKGNRTYFVNEGFPIASTSAPKVCTLTLEKFGPEVKQIRLDFLTFQLREPVNGTCFYDRLAITGQDINDIIPEICGENSGQHIYVDVEDSRGPFSINVVMVGEYFPRNFRIKITQLSQTEDLAPKNCLQFYTEPTGAIQTFNYKHEVEENAEDIIPGYFNNLNYAICIKKAKGFCSISYENEETEETPIPSFQLVNVDIDGEKLLPSRQAGAETFDCPDDYIVINGIRLCGEKLNDATAEIDFTKNYPVTDTSNGPFVVSVRTDATINGRDAGYCLRLLGFPCSDGIVKLQEIK